MFAYVLILMVIPEELMFVKLGNYFIELKFWLESRKFSTLTSINWSLILEILRIKDVILNDPDNECKQRASECIALSVNRLKSKIISA